MSCDIQKGKEPEGEGSVAVTVPRSVSVSVTAETQVIKSVCVYCVKTSRQW